MSGKISWTSSRCSTINWMVKKRVFRNQTQVLMDLAQVDLARVILDRIQDLLHRRSKRRKMIQNLSKLSIRSMYKSSRKVAVERARSQSTTRRSRVALEWWMIRCLMTKKIQSFYANRGGLSSAFKYWVLSWCENQCLLSERGKQRWAPFYLLAWEVEHLWHLESIRKRWNLAILLGKTMILSWKKV